MIKDKASYLKTENANSPDFDIHYYEGMSMAYYYILDGIKSYIEDHEELTLEEFGLEDYDPKEIYRYKPLNYKE